MDTINSPHNLPFFSIVMPCYNVEKYVEKALISIFNQNYDGKIQFVIVDDGSTDQTWQVIQRAVATTEKKLDICLVRHKQNKGVAAATDTAYRHAQGEWIIKADSDDIQMPDRCAAYASLITKYPEARSIILSCQRMDENETPLEHVSYCACNYRNVPAEIYLNTPEERYLNAMGLSNYPSFYPLGGTTAIHREIYEKWGDLMTDAHQNSRFSDDTVWSCRYTLSAPVVGSKHIACMYRSRSSGNLEYRRQGKNYSAFLQEELSSSLNMMARAESHKLCSRAAERALNNTGLSDWKPEHITALAIRNQGEEIYFSARATWWNWNWCKRLSWLKTNKQKMLIPHQEWCMRRLLPLPIICILKAILKR